MIRVIILGPKSTIRALLGGKPNGHETHSKTIRYSTYYRPILGEAQVSHRTTKFTMEDSSEGSDDDTVTKEWVMKQIMKVVRRQDAMNQAKFKTLEKSNGSTAKALKAQRSVVEELVKEKDSPSVNDATDPTDHDTTNWDEELQRRMAACDMFNLIKEKCPAIFNYR